MSDVRIRQLREEDLTSLDRRLYKPDRFRNNFKRQEEGLGIALVAVDPDRGHVGCGFLVWPAGFRKGGYSPWRDEKLVGLRGPVITDLEVSAKARGCNVGTQLEAVLRGVAFSKGFDVVHLGVNHKNLQRPDVDGDRVLQFYLEKGYGIEGLLTGSGRLLDLKAPPRHGDYHLLTRAQPGSFLPYIPGATERVSPVFAKMVQALLKHRTVDEQKKLLRWMLESRVGQWRQKNGTFLGSPPHEKLSEPNFEKEDLFPQPINEKVEIPEGSEFICRPNILELTPEDLSDLQPLEQSGGMPARLGIKTPSEYAYLRATLFALLGSAWEGNEEKTYEILSEKMRTKLREHAHPAGVPTPEFFHGFRTSKKYAVKFAMERYCMLAGQQEWTQNNQCLHLHADGNARTTEDYKHESGVILHCSARDGMVEIFSPSREVSAMCDARTLAFFTYGKGDLTLSVPSGSLQHLENDYVRELETRLNVRVDVVSPRPRPQSHLRPVSPPTPHAPESRSPRR